MRKFFVLSLICIGGCASNSGVVNIGPNTYVVSRQASTGLGGMGTLRADALKEGAQQCKNENKVMRVVEEKESKPPYIFGNFPRIDVTFACG